MISFRGTLCQNLVFGTFLDSVYLYFCTWKRQHVGCMLHTKGQYVMVPNSKFLRVNTNIFVRLSTF